MESIKIIGANIGGMTRGAVTASALHAALRIERGLEKWFHMHRSTFRLNQRDNFQPTSYPPVDWYLDVDTALRIANVGGGAQSVRDGDFLNIEVPNVAEESAEPPRELVPIVFERDGEIYASSKDVATYFGKLHPNVLQSIRNAHCSAEFRRMNFHADSYINSLGDEITRRVDMTKDGFTLIVMGFNGAEAGAFKEKYIAAFNAMAAQLRKAQPVAVDLDDVDTLHSLLLTHTAKIKALRSEKAALEAASVEMAPKVAFYDAYCDGEGNYTLQNASIALRLQPNRLGDVLRKNGFLHHRGGINVPYHDYKKFGYFVVKNWATDKKSGCQTLVTPRGIEHFGSILLALQAEADRLDGVAADLFTKKAA